MGSRTFNIFCFFNLLIVFSIVLLPIESKAQMQNPIFRNITSDDGLPVTTVTDATQDSFGYIWIGTWDGVYRYDGNTFEKKSDQGRYVTADQKGGVWISYNREGIIAYHSTQSDSLAFFDIAGWEGRYSKITIDAAGTVWAESGNGLEYFNESTKAFEKDSETNSEFPHGQIIAHKNGSLSFFYLEPNVKWGIGHRSENGSVQYDDYPIDQNNPDPSMPFNASSVPNMERYLDNGILLINAFGWAYKENYDADWIFVKPDQPDILLKKGDIITHNNHLYVQHLNSLTKFNIQTGASVTFHHNPLNPKSILPAEQLGAGTQLFIDRQEVLWIPSFSYGFSRLNLYESDFGLLRSKDGTPIRDVISAIELEDGSFWIGSRVDNYGLLHFDAEGNIMQRYSGRFNAPPGKSVSINELSHPYVWSLAVGTDGSIWAGTGSPGPNNGGLNRIRPGTEEVTRFKHDPNNEASLYQGNWIGKIIEDGSSRIWVRSRNDLAWVDPKTEIITRFNHPENLNISNEETINLLKTDSGDLIVSTETNKFYRIHHQDLSTEKIDLNVNWEKFTRIKTQDVNNRYWAGSNQGFGLLDSTLTSIEQWYDIETYGFPVSQIYTMQFDNENNAWFGTDNGIIKFDTSSEEATHYSYERGLQGNHYQEHLNYRGPSGKIYLGGNGGINIFDPSQIQSNPHPPEMVFTNLTLDGKTVIFGPNKPIISPLQVANEVVIQPDISSIRLDFAALHFAGDQSNQYQYMLEGFDSDWRDGGSVGQASYTNLSPKAYTFKIRGSNLDGVWSSDETSIRLIVLPPWYLTWWAYALYILIFCVLGYSLHRYQRARAIRAEREKAREKELEQAKEIEKANKQLEESLDELKATQSQLIQSEKMASLGELTAGIAHEIQNPLNFVNNFAEVNSELLEEMKEELDKGNLKEVKSLADDIDENEKKIIFHGKRADSIVKGMLQHSQNSNGKKEPTNINMLADEYLRLAYHGLRAKDKAFNADMETDFDESIKTISIIPQDIGRVVLNLVTNAFYAVNEKSIAAKASGDTDYKPLVCIATKKKKNAVEIIVTDNGNGIPERVLDKIFQPFFTTKPTGQGTGLGLSMCYDIVTKGHGGELTVETKEGQGTTFIINLPE
jgi:signal transduction histidine kinase/ligand-binding sensor domain-containing protein